MVEDLAGAPPYAAPLTAVAELHERELIKMARLADALTAGLGAVFWIGFERWVAGPRSGNLAAVLRESLEQLRGLTAG
jgi:hypothetical protein